MGIGKSKSKQESKNLAYPFLQGELGGSVGTVGRSTSGIEALLSGDVTGLENYKDATGFNRELSSGLSDITGAGAAKGLLRSGSTGKALMNYGEELQSRRAGDYIKNLLGLGQLGLGSAGVIAGAGQTSKGNSSSKSLGAGGLGG